jgi:two-component system, chemotaxis family, CheB/CheR fusion protein
VVELSEVVARATEATAHQFAARGQELVVSLPVEPVYLEADPLRLEQVLTNLLANAAKYTDPEGDIRLTAHVEARQILLRVRDNGQGIALSFRNSRPASLLRQARDDERLLDLPHQAGWKCRTS